MINEPGTDYRAAGAGWLTQMARLAATELDADWVIHTDADEFWWPVEGSLTDTLAAIPAGTAWWWRRGSSSWAGPTARDRSPSASRFARRARGCSPRSPIAPNPTSSAWTGARTTSPSRGRTAIAETLRPPGRAVHRTVRETESTEEEPSADETRLVWAPMWPLRILHFPVRSSAQFKRRTEVAIFEGHYPDWGRFKRLREIYEEGRLEELYAELVARRRGRGGGDPRGTARPRRALRAPSAALPRSARRRQAGTLGVESSPEEVEAERDELEFDAMQLLARTSRWTTLQRERGRERSESLMDRRQGDGQGAGRRPAGGQTQGPPDRGEEQARRAGREPGRATSASKWRSCADASRAERARPWSRMRRRVTGLRRRVGKLLERRGKRASAKVAACRGTSSPDAPASSARRSPRPSSTRAPTVVGVDAFTDYYPRDRKEAQVAAAREHAAFEFARARSGRGTAPGAALRGRRRHLSPRRPPRGPCELGRRLPGLSERQPGGNPRHRRGRRRARPPGRVRLLVLDLRRRPRLPHQRGHGAGADLALRSDQAGLRAPDRRVHPGLRPPVHARFATSPSTGHASDPTWRSSASSRPWRPGASSRSTATGASRGTSPSSPTRWPRRSRRWTRGPDAADLQRGRRQRGHDSGCRRHARGALRPLARGSGTRTGPPATFAGPWRTRRASGRSSVGSRASISAAGWPRSSRLSARSRRRRASNPAAIGSNLGVR